MAMTSTSSLSLVLLLALASGVQAQSGQGNPESYWEVPWNETSPIDPGVIDGNGEVFTGTGELIPGVDVATIVETAARSWNSDTLKESVGEICLAFGPTATQLLGSTVRDVCEPVLESLRSGEPVQGVSEVCQAVWETEEEEEEESLVFDSFNEWNPIPSSQIYEDLDGVGEDIIPPVSSGRERDFWDIPNVGAFNPSQFLQEIFGFTGDSKYTTCFNLGTVIYNQSLSGRDLVKNVTSNSVRRLLPVSLLSCDEPEDGGEAHLGTVLLQVFTAISGGNVTNHFCDYAGGLEERSGPLFDELVAGVTQELLTALVDDVSRCNALLRRLEAQAMWAGIHTEMGYESVEDMCVTVQHMLTNPDPEYQFAPDDEEVGESDMERLGLGLMKVVRAAGSFINSGTIREGFVGLCQSLSRVSSNADRLMCAAVETDTPTNLIQQCLSLCGMVDYPVFPEEGSGDSRFPREGSGDSESPGEGSDDSSSPEGSGDSRFRRDVSDDSRFRRDVSDDSRFPEGSGDSGFPEGSGDSGFSGEGSDDSRSPEGSDDSRFPEGSGDSRYPWKVSGDSRFPWFPWLQQEGSGDSRFPWEGSGDSRFPWEGSGHSRFPWEGSGDAKTPWFPWFTWLSHEGSGDSRFPWEGSGQSRFPWEGSGDSRFPWEGSGESRFPWEGSGDSRFPWEGSGDSKTPWFPWFPWLQQEGSGDSRFPLEGSGDSRFPWEGSGDSKTPWLPWFPWLPHEGSGDSRFPWEGSGDSNLPWYPWFPREGSGDSRFPWEGSGDSKLPWYLWYPWFPLERYENSKNEDNRDPFDNPDVSAWWFSSNLFGKWVGFSHGELLRNWFSEWFELRENYDEEKVPFPLPGLKHLLEDILDSHDANEQTICQRFGWKIHENSITVRDIVVEILDNILEYLADSAPQLCGELSDGSDDTTGDGESRDGDSPQPGNDTMASHPQESDDLPSKWENGHLGPLTGEVVAELFAYLGGYDSKDSMCRDAREEGYSNTIELRVVGMRKKLLDVTWNEHVCSDVLHLIKDDLHLFGDPSDDYRDAEAMCADISYAYGPQNTAHLGEIIRGDGWLDMRGFLMAGGKLFNTTIRDAALVPCDILSGTHLGSSEMERQCNLFSDPDPAPLIEECTAFLKEGLWLHDLYDFDEWWSSFIPSWIYPWKSDGNHLFDGIMNGDAAALFYNLFAYNPGSSPKAICKKAEMFAANSTLTMEFLFDQAIDSTLRFFAHASPELCYGDKSPGPADGHLEFGYKNVTDAYSTDFLGALFTFLGHYENPDELCRDSTEAVLAGADPHHLDFVVSTMKGTIYDLMKHADVCEVFMDFMQETPDSPISVAVLGFENNRMFCEALQHAYDPHAHGDIDVPAVERRLRYGRDSGGWGFLHEDLIQLFGDLYHAGTVKDVVAEACGIFGRNEHTGLLLGDDFYPLCEWADKPHNRKEFIDVCLSVVEEPWDPVDDDHDDEDTDGSGQAPSTEEEILDFLRFILSDPYLTYEGLVSWVRETFGLDISTDESLCGSARDMLSNEDVTIPVIVDTVMDVAIRMVGKASPWLCSQGSEATVAPTQIPGFNQSGMPHWAETMMEDIDMHGVDPLDVLGDVFSFLGNYSNTDDLCRDSVAAVAEGADPALLDDMVNKFKASIYSMMNNPDHCTPFVDLMQNSLDIPFSVGDLIGFAGNRGLCEAISRAFDPTMEEHIDLSILRPIIYPSESELFETVREDSGSGMSGDGEDEPIIPEEWQALIRELIKVAGRLYNSGTITRAIGTTCDILYHVDIGIGYLVPEIGQVCDWSYRGSDPDEFYEFCVDFVDLPWDDSPDDGHNPWEDEPSTEEQILDFLRFILSDPYLTYEGLVSWVRETFGLDISTDESLCGSARDMLSNEDVTIPVIVDTVMDVAIRMVGKASPWLCSQGSEATVAPTQIPGFNQSGMPHWAETMMEDIDMHGVDPLDVLGDVFSFLGNYSNADDLCRDSVAAVAEGADPALLDDMVNKFKASIYSMMNNPDHCTPFVDLMQNSLDIPFSVGDLIGFAGNRGLCEAISRAFDPTMEEHIDLSILRPIIYPSESELFETVREDSGSGMSGDGEDEPIIPEEWQALIRELIKVAGRLYNSGTITRAIGTTCDFLYQADIGIDYLVPEIGQVCDWSHRGSDLDEFYHFCVDFVDLPWDDSPDDGHNPWEDDPSTEEQILDFLRFILSDPYLTYEGLVSWVRETFGLDISTDESLCGSARDMLSNEDVTIPVIVDTVMDVAIRMVGKASPWLCSQGSEATVAPTQIPGFNQSGMPHWAETMMEDIDMHGVDPLDVLGDVFSFLGNYSNADDLCRDSVAAVAEGADPALLDDMVNKFKASIYSMMNNPDHCTPFVDLMQNSLDIPFSVGDLIGFAGNRGLCEAISRAFDPTMEEHIDLSILRPIIYPSESEHFETVEEDAGSGMSGDGEDEPIIPEEWQALIRELIKVAGRLYNSGTITRAIGTTCDFLYQADIGIDYLVPEIGQVCDWSHRGSDLDEFYEFCVDFVDLPWDDSPDDGHNPWEDEPSTEEQILDFLRFILSDPYLTYEDFVSWVRETFGLDISTDESLCGSARDMLSNEDVTIPVIVDTVMDVAIRMVGKASPWLCSQGSEATVAPTQIPGFNQSGMPHWAETMMEDIDMQGVDPLDVLGDVFSFLGNYSNTDDLCRDSVAAVAEGADPALLDDMVNKFKASIYSMMNNPDHCTPFVDLMQNSLDIPFSVGDLIGFAGNRGLCEAISRAFDPTMEEHIDLSILRPIIYPSESEHFETVREDAGSGMSGDGEDEPIIPEEWQALIRELIKVAGRLYNSGTITRAIGTTCDILYQADIGIDYLVPEIGQVCDWSHRGSDLDEFYHFCVGFVDLPWDDSPDDGHNPWEDEPSTEEQILDFLRFILSDPYLTYEGLVSWVRETFGLDISTDESLCGSARDMLSNEDVTIPVIVDTVMDVAIRMVGKASPWLCSQGSEATVAPTQIPGFNQSGMPHWAETMMEDIDMQGVDPLDVLGDVFSFLGNYSNTDDLCRDSVAAVAEGADPALLDDMVNKFKASIYSMMNNPDHCTPFVDLMQNSLDIPFSVGDLIGFAGNRGLCEAISRAFDPTMEEHIDLSILRPIIYPSESEHFETVREDAGSGMSGDGEDEPIIPEEWQTLIRELIKVAGRLYNSGTITRAIGTTCDFLYQADIGIDYLVPEIGQICDWSHRGSDLDEFYEFCVDFVDLPWDDSPDDGHNPWEDEPSTEEQILDFLRFILSDPYLTYEGLVSWVRETFGLDISTDESLCGSARDMLSNEDVTIPVIVDTVMDVAIRMVGKASPWLCSQGSEATVAPTQNPGFNQSGMPHWAETMMEDIDMHGVDPLDVLGDVFSFLGNYSNADDLCRDSVAAVAEGADPALLDDMVNKFKASIYSMMNNPDHCTPFVDLMQSSLDIPFSVGDLIGFAGNRGLCEAISRAFDPTMEEHIDLSILRPIIYPSESEHFETVEEEAGSGMSGDGEDEPIIPEEWQALIRELIKVAGRLYNSGTITRAIGTTCDFLYQADIGIDNLVPEIGQVCDWSDRGSDLDEFYHFCVDFVELPWDDEPECQDGWWAVLLSQPPSEFGQGGNIVRDEEAVWSDESENMDVSSNSLNRFVKNILEQLHSSLSNNPFTTCETFGASIHADTADVLAFGKSVAKGLFSSSISEQKLSAKCLEYYRNTSSSIFNPPGFTVFDESEIHLSNLVGNFQNGSSFCDYLLSFEEDERGRAVLNAVVDGALSSTNDVGLCNSAVNLLFGNDRIDTFQQITSFETVLDFCGSLYDSFNDRANATDFQLQIPADFDLSTYTLERGELLPGVSFKDVLYFAGSLLTTTKFRDSLNIACDALAPLFDDSVNQGFSHIATLCNSINGNDTEAVVLQCEQVLIPQVYGEDFPISLRPFDVGQLLLDSVLPYFNIEPRFEMDVICPAIETVLNSDTGPKEMAAVVVNAMLRTGIQYGSSVCQEMDKVFNQLAPDVEFLADRSDVEFVERLLEERQQFERRFYGTFAFASTMAGFDDTEQMCEALIEATGGQETFDYLVNLLRERAFSYLTDEAECEIAVESLVRYVNVMNQEEQAGNLLYQVTGYYSPRAFCIPTTAAFRGETITQEDCPGIEDCAGVCDGDAVFDCAGECGGSAVRDCVNVCNGQATINGCNRCVGGTTGLGQEYGTDKCGACWSAPDYRITWDCHDTCNGTAFYDACQDCVGGETGKLATYNKEIIDCRGVCNGNWEEDSCGFCEPFDESTLGVANKYVDCSGECFTPGASSNRAQLNLCNICYGGNTGLNETSGINACGQCLTDDSADESSCAGCDGVPNSGKELDACGVCGGNGTSCFGVGWLVPSLVTENSNTQLEVYGAGFDLGSSLLCVFEDVTDGSQTQSETTYGDYISLTCNVPGLAAGEYNVKVDRDGIISDSIFAKLYVEPVIEILSVSPSELTINSSAETVSITVTASENAFTSVKATSGAAPLLIIEGDFNAIVPGSFDDLSDSVLLFTLPMPFNSGQVTVYPTLNGVERLTASDGSGFTLTAYAPAPEFTEAYFAPTGAAVIIRFSSGVNFNEFSNCEDVFADTSKLGDSPLCRWVGSTTMYIILGTGSDLLTVGDELVIKSDSVKAFRQTYARYVTGSRAVEGPANPVVPTVVLIGKERLTSCGTVRLTGRRSQGGAGRAMTFTWAVASQGETTAIEEILADESGVDLSLPGTLMDAEIEYTFSLSAQNFLGETDTAYVNVSRSALAVPEVDISVRGVDPENVLVSDSFTLTAEVTFYSDCVPPGETVFSWSVDMPDVPLNLKTKNRRTLFVDPNSLPGDTTVTFTILIYKSGNETNSVSQSYAVKTKYSDLVPIIYGGSELTVGRDSGLLVLDGSGSFDLDQVAADMNYEWQCFQVTDSTSCWSFREGEEGTTFPSADAASMAALSISANSMEADKTYEFTLVVSKLTRTASTSVLVTALNGDPPKVEIGTVFDGRILSEDSLSLAATISHKLPLTSYVWETVGDDEGYAFLDLSDTSNLDSPASLFPYSKSNGSISFITIKAGKLTAGSTYQIRLTANTADGQYGAAKIQFTVVAGVTSCVFTLNGATSYTELSSIMYTVDNCVADESAYPLSYRVFLVSGSRRQTVTEKTSSPAIEGVGKSRTDESSGTNTFVAEVCDAYQSCAYFDLTVDVEQLTQCTADGLEQLLEDLVTVQKFKQNYANALLNFNEIQSKCENSTSARRRRRSIPDDTSVVAAEQLSLLQSNIESSVLDINSAQLLIDQCSYINTNELSLTDKTTFVDILVELVAVYEDEGEACPADSAAVVVDQAANVRNSLNATTHSSLLATIISLTDSLSQAQMNQLQLGAAALETISAAQTSSVQRAIPSGTFYSKSSGGNSVDFGTALGNTFSADWACSSGTCSGVTVSFDHWETGQDEFSLTDEDRDSVAADITDIKLLDPSSGEELTIANLTERINISMTLTQTQAGKTYECRYWDTGSQTWAADGLETVLDSGDATAVTCLTDHLTAFTVLGVDSATSAAPSSSAVSTAGTGAGTDDVSTTEESEEPIEVPQSGGSSTTIIIAAVCGAVAVVLLAVVVAAVVVRAKKRSNKVIGDDLPGVDANGTEPRPLTPAADDQWASQRPVTARRSPSPRSPQHTTVQVVAVPVAMQTAPLNSLAPPSTSSTDLLVADMNNPAPPPVYLPPALIPDNDSLDIASVY